MYSIKSILSKRLAYPNKSFKNGGFQPAGMQMYLEKKNCRFFKYFEKDRVRLRLLMPTVHLYIRNCNWKIFMLAWIVREKSTPKCIRCWKFLNTCESNFITSFIFDLYKIFLTRFITIFFICYTFYYNFIRTRVCRFHRLDKLFAFSGTNDK